MAFTKPLNSEICTVSPNQSITKMTLEKYNVFSESSDLSVVERR